MQQLDSSTNLLSIKYKIDGQFFILNTKVRVWILG